MSKNYKTSIVIQVLEELGFKKIDGYAAYIEQGSKLIVSIPNIDVMKPVFFEAMIAQSINFGIINRSRFDELYKQKSGETYDKKLDFIRATDADALITMLKNVIAIINDVWDSDRPMDLRQKEFIRKNIKQIVVTTTGHEIKERMLLP